MLISVIDVSKHHPSILLIDLIRDMIQAGSVLISVIDVSKHHPSILLIDLIRDTILKQTQFEQSNQHLQLFTDKETKTKQLDQTVAKNLKAV